MLVLCSEMTPTLFVLRCGNKAYEAGNVGRVCLKKQVRGLYIDACKSNMQKLVSF